MDEKKSLIIDPKSRKQLIDIENNQISISRQCELLNISKSSYYYKSYKKSNRNDELIMNEIDKIYTKYPFYGSRRIKVELVKLGFKVNRKKIQRLMRIMNLIAIYPKPSLSKRNIDHKTYPYLLRDVKIAHVNHVWSTDITYIKMKNGFVFLTAVIDWYSRYVLSWKVSNTLHTDFCIDAVKEALKHGKPKIFNTDQGSQYTSDKFTSVLLNEKEILISMDGKGRALDNIFVERLWRTVKYEEIFINEYDSIRELKDRLEKYFKFYNFERPHQSLDYKTPWEIFSINEKGEKEFA
jgi:putative transposase